MSGGMDERQWPLSKDIEIERLKKENRKLRETLVAAAKDPIKLTSVGKSLFGSPMTPERLQELCNSLNDGYLTTRVYGESQLVNAFIKGDDLFVTRRNW